MLFDKMAIHAVGSSTLLDALMTQNYGDGMKDAANDTKAYVMEHDTKALMAELKATPYRICPHPPNIN